MRTDKMTGRSGRRSENRHTRTGRRYGRNLAGILSAAFAAAVLCISSFCANVMAQETAAKLIVSQTEEEVLYTDAPGEGRKGLHLDKKIFPQGNGVYTVMLEAYADRSLTAYERPADYYLVLDVSTSMSYFDYPDSPDGKRLGALKKAASDFVDMAAARNPSASEQEQSRIAIVRFSDAEHSGVVCGLTPLTAAGAGELKDSIGKLECNHLTRTDLGMLYTEQLIAAQANDRDRIIILVTDGQPNNKDGFQPSVANAALACAARLKTVGVRIYTVSIENHAAVNAGGKLPEYEKDAADDTDPDFLYMFPEVSYEGGPAVNTSNENAYAMTDRFMHLISSNNPRAMSMDLPDGTDPSAPGRTIAEDGTCYYITAQNMAALSGIFAELADSKAVYDPCLTVNSQVRDIVAKDFIVKDGGQISTFVADRIRPEDSAAGNADVSGGSEKSDADKEAVEWGDYKKEDLQVVASGDTVKVCGFDFREKKLAILFDIIRRPETKSQGWVPTNAEISGVYENDSAEEALAYFPIPKVKLESGDQPAKTEEPKDTPAKTEEPKDTPANTGEPKESAAKTGEPKNTPAKTETPSDPSAQPPAVVNTVLKPAQPVFEVHTSTPVTTSVNTQQAVTDKADRPLPVTADESENRIWFLIIAAVFLLLPASFYLADRNTAEV